MERIVSTVRPDYGKKLEAIGLSFWAWDNYWKEDVCYRFNAAQIDEIEAATEELHHLCMQAVKYAIEHERLSELQIPGEFHAAIKASFAADDFSLYGRFDLAYDGVNPPKMLEYNADTPTSILESAVAQWYWMEEVFSADDQFNSLHEKLVARWAALPDEPLIHFASIADNEEDWVAVTYLMETAIQAGKQAVHITMDQIGWDARLKTFVDMENKPIRCMFKLYPWEWLMRESFGSHIAESATRFIEPIWKSVLSCKGILPLLWELFPNHPNLLEAHFERPEAMTAFAKKPLFSREGANIELHQEGKLLQHSNDGPYGEEGHVYQALFTLPDFQGMYPVIGSWVVGSEPAGMCIREDVSPITTNMSYFVPHVFR
jgi:glutathionylspermidine synthase